MTAQFERVKGVSSTLNRESLTAVVPFQLLDTIPTTAGGDYFDTVASMAMAWIKQNLPVYDTPFGRLHWNTIQLQENHYAQNYGIAVTYGPHDHQAGAYQLTIDQAGGTVNVKSGIRISGWGSKGDGAGGLKGGIGENEPTDNSDYVDNDGQIDIDPQSKEVRGVDIPVEETKITVSFRHPEAFLNAAYIKKIGKMVGYPNNDTFLTYEPGEVLYLGGNFTETNTEASASYTFVISYNATDLTIGGQLQTDGSIVGGIVIGEKKGWDVLSPVYVQEKANGRTVTLLKYIEIIRPAGREWKNFVTEFGWGGS